MCVCVCVYLRSRHSLSFILSNKYSHGHCLSAAFLASFLVEALMGGKDRRTNICLTTRKTQQQHYFLNTLDYIRKGLPLFLKTRTLYWTLEMTLSISMWNIQGLNSSAFGLKVKHRIPEEHQGDGHYNSTRHGAGQTQSPTAHPTTEKSSYITKTRYKIWYKSKLHNHIQGSRLTFALGALVRLTFF